MATAITRFLITLLFIVILPLALVSCEQRTPQQKTQAQQQETQTAGTGDYEELLSQYKQGKKQAAPQPVENPVFAEWKDMRARRVREGTKLHWRLQVYGVFSDEFWGRLEGNWDYPVSCSLTMAPSSAFKVARDDWVDVVGMFLKVDRRGHVKIAMETLNNLGPR